MKFIKWVGASLDTDTKGMSARKASAFVIIVCVLAAHVAWLRNAFNNNDFSLLTSVLTIDYGFIALLLGLTTWSTLKSKQIEEEKKD